MKFCKNAVLSLAALSYFITLDCEAFVPNSKRVTRTTTSFLTTKNCERSYRTNQLFLKVNLEGDDGDSEEEPLGKGVDSVSWLPSVFESNVEPTTTDSGNDAEVLPLFPLGGFVYTPNTEHVLNIFEPRYRKMYSDILMNGTKRFVVSTSHPSEKGRFAATGVLFELEDLKEVSEKTGDQIKFICNHRVTGRVTIHRVLNPEVWETRETYLKVQGTIHDDSGKNDDNEEKPISGNDVYRAVVDAFNSANKEEEALRESFSKLVDLQHELEEDVRFTKISKSTLAVKDGPGKDGLWETVGLWQSFVDQRLLARQNELQRDFQEKLQEFLKNEKGYKDDELPSTIGLQDLSPALQREVVELQKRISNELKPLVLESSLTMQKILEAPNHKERCRLLKFFVEAERKRLDTKRSLKSVFSSTSANVDTTKMPPEEMIPLDEKESTRSRKQDSPPRFFDEPDAFQ